MARVTNTGGTPIPLGSVVLQPHSTAEVPDDVLAEAKKAKVVEGWFANGTLKSDDEEAEKDEAEKLAQQHPTGTPGTAPGSGGFAQPHKPDDPNKK
jgi:hypothetical protein